MPPGLRKPAREPPLVHPRCHHQGQALVVAVALLLVLALALLHLIDVGRLTREKIRLQNTADAAAYGVAAMEARALNFVAYVNRAKVANDVMVAQLVSLSSTGQAYQIAGRNLGVVSKLACKHWCSAPDPTFVTKVNCAICEFQVKSGGSLGKFYKPVGKKMKQASDGLLKSGFRFYYDKILTGLQTAALAATLGNAMFAVDAPESGFLDANDPEVELASLKLSNLPVIPPLPIPPPGSPSWVPGLPGGLPLVLKAHLAQWALFIEYHSRKKGPAMERLAEVTRASRDVFSEKRDAFRSLGFGFLFRKGETSLKHDSLRWSARDKARFVFSPPLPLPPVVSGSGSRSHDALSSYWGIAEARFTAGSKSLDSECGQGDKIAREAPAIFLPVRKLVSHQPASGLAAGPSEVRAIARARAFYTELDETEQCGNLFQPYWEPRLAPSQPDLKCLLQGGCSPSDVIDGLLYAASIDGQLLRDLLSLLTGGRPPSSDVAPAPDLARYEEP